MLPVTVPVLVLALAIVPVMFPVLGEAVLTVGQWPPVSPVIFAEVIAAEQSVEAHPVGVPVLGRVVLSIWW